MSRVSYIIRPLPHAFHFRGTHSFCSMKRQFFSTTSSQPRSLVNVEKVEAIAVVTLNHPEKRNALSCDMMAALQQVFQGVQSDHTIRCSVLTAVGNVFCSGHDLKEMTSHYKDDDGGAAFFARTMAQCSEMMQLIAQHPLPVIAAVDGLATAAGCQLAASCDMIVASQKSQFCTPGVNIGLFCSTPAVALTRVVPIKSAMEMLLLGEMIPATEAHRIGLVNRVVPDGQALPVALSLARHIASRSAVALQIGKRAVTQQLNLPLKAAYTEASHAMVQNMLTSDAQEGITSFLAKRKPEWKHQ